MKSVRYMSVAILWGLAAIPSVAQDVIVFDKTGVMVKGPIETELLTFELPTTDRFAADIEDESWAFAEAEKLEVEWSLAPDPAQIIAEAEEVSPIVTEAKVRVEKAEAPARRVEVDVKPPPVVHNKPPEMEDLMDQGKVLRLYAIQFDYNKATLRSEAMPTIKRIAAALRRAPALSIFIEGHTDARGSDAFNMHLSRRRAAAVVDALVNIHAIDRSRLTPVGFGESRLLNEKSTEEAHQQNRRVELRRRT